MKKVIKNLHTLLPCDQFIVTGSAALHYMGLVDIFIEKATIDTQLTVDGVQISKIDRIINQKKKANRLKDWAQLKHLSLLFCTEADFDKYVYSTKYGDIK